MFKIVNQATLDRMVNEKNEFHKTVEELERTRTRLEENVRKLNNEKKQLELDKKIELDDIKHMIKIKEEKLDIEFEKRVNKKEIQLERDKDKAISLIKDEYRIKTEEQLEKSYDEMRGMYTEVLKRLPDVNVAFKGNV